VSGRLRKPAAPTFGLTEWFRQGEQARVLACLDNLAGLEARWLRTHLSWAEYHSSGGQEWYDWLVPAIASRVELLPCIHYTPPSLSRTGASSGPPRRLRDLADFVDHLLDRYGRHFPHIELWNEPNNLLDWDWRVDQDWNLFAEMVGGAAYWAKKRGWAVVLGGPCPFDLNWLDLMGQRGVLAEVSAVGIHGFPGTWDSDAGGWGGWSRHVGELRGLLSRHDAGAEIWITEAGYSTWRHDELEQARRFLDALDAPAERLYWYALADLPPDMPIQEGRQFDIRHYHMGVLDIRGRDKLLARLLRRGGVSAVRQKVTLAHGSVARSARPILVTGGAGFIGSNIADALLAQGEEVLIFDNFSRAGSSTNIDWLRDRHGERAVVHAADIRDANALAEAAEAAAAVVHLAAQVAVTESLLAPLEDFTVNAGGTLHLLEALRRKSLPTPLVFASTNKVYGDLAHIPVEQIEDSYRPVDRAVACFGIGEGQKLDLATPYGCSKGAADQYVLDYARSFGLPTVVMRMSCIYGPRQFGTEDQGWVAHFLMRALADEPITIFGDGRQVRDILHVQDAVRAYLGVLARVDELKGRAFNLGGGTRNAVSLRMVLRAIERLLGRPVRILTEPTRTGDQLYFVADTRRLALATGWRAQLPWDEGLADLLAWTRELQGRRTSRGGRSVRGAAAASSPREWSLTA
jgi:CDP-paratose 2-epimerase